MRIATKLTIVQITIALCAKLSARQTAVIINLTEQSPGGVTTFPAPMPYFMEFRKYVGMHAGHLPGYPASHGCVRMPRDLAAEFFARVQMKDNANDHASESN
jgi:lipoprotein-anchoring transpeptidase ErfK/SrfK